MESGATRSSRIWRDWTVANSIGFALAFLSFIPGILIADEFMPPGFRAALPESIDPNALPTWLDQQTYDSWYLRNLTFHMMALPLFGLIVGGLQGRVLAPYLRTLVPWVSVTALAFVSLLFFELVERHVVTGPHAGPIEPIIISLGGSSLAGILQWYVLRREGIGATRWLSVWVLGSVLGIACGAVASIMAMTLTQPLVDLLFDGTVAEMVAWSRDMLVLGAVFGGVVGAASGSTLLKAVSPSIDAG